ncbi:hypothetical protein AYI69_g2272 [Smittium culicis]|uniref:Uncharacterized protein n=1 Tax=Smittium culicis TaxID=133412 RepID=A0A1R1YMV9_9FUNG|nr:hypothetical protein AYI69_g2272 [Smittium culicis]
MRAVLFLIFIFSSIVASEKLIANEYKNDLNIKRQDNDSSKADSPTSTSSKNQSSTSSSNAERATASTSSKNNSPTQTPASNNSQNQSDAKDSYTQTRNENQTNSGSNNNVVLINEPTFDLISPSVFFYSGSSTTKSYRFLGITSSSVAVNFSLLICFLVFVSLA